MQTIPRPPGPRPTSGPPPDAAPRDHWLRRWTPLAAVSALLVAAAFAAAHATPRLDRLDDGPVDTTDRSPDPVLSPEAEPAPPPRPDAGVELPSWLMPALTAVLVLIAAAVLAAVVWTVLRRLLRRRPTRADAGTPPTRGPAPGDPRVLAAVDAGLADLSDTDRDPRRAVIACWLRLEEAAQAAGTPRAVGDTPTDLVTRLLTSGGVVSADVLAGFAAVYHEARYATHPVDELMRQQAVTALRRIRAELAVDPAPVAP